MEQHRNFTIMMTSDGLFEKAYPIKNALIGYEVEYEPMIQKQWLAVLKEKFFTMRVAALACVFLIALLPLYMWTNHNSTYAYVDIDINPSIELEINEDLKIISIVPFNDDAVLLIEKLGDVKGKDIELVVDKIIAASEETGLVNAEKNVLIGVHYVEEEINKSVLDVIDQHFTEKASDWDILTVEISEKLRETAEEYNISMNKVLANTVKEEAVENIDSMTEEDNQVLQSFFNKHPRTKVEITTEDAPDETKVKPTIKPDVKERTLKPTDKGIHPSELKKKNGELNSAKSRVNEKKINQQQKNSGKPMDNIRKHHQKNNEKKQEKGMQKKDPNNWKQDKRPDSFKSKPAEQWKSKSDDHHKRTKEYKGNGQQNNHDKGPKGNGKNDD